MYYPVPKGSEEIIQGYKCQLPPEGYGKNILTGELEFVGVISRSEKQPEQYWERISLPEDWNKKVKAETEKRKLDENYVDDELEKIRQEHWRYRLCGLWVMINGKATYINRSYYYFLNWCVMDIGYPKYRDTDRRFFYVWEYCEEDPRCAGLIDVERRRSGKSYKSGSILLGRTSIAKNHHAGIQSKTAPDAKSLFQRSVVAFFKKLPEFFRPIYDQSKGVTPTSELRFFQTTIKGRKAEKVLEGLELESWIDWGASEDFNYDGHKLNTYVMDEAGKCIDNNVWNRWNVVRFCLDQDGNWIGKALVTTTVEEMEVGGRHFKELWDASHESTRDKNGRTSSGLYQFFWPAHETTFFDKYGMPEKERAYQYYMNQREGLKGDAHALSSIIRKNPFTIEEAFRIDGTKCLYNPEKLNDQRDYLSWNKELTIRGNFEWEKGIRDSKVIWVDNPHGRWEMPRGFIPSVVWANNVQNKGGLYVPLNNVRFGASVDPYDHNTTEDNRRSMAASLVKMKNNISDFSDPFIGSYVCKYKARPATAPLMYEDMVKQCVFFGCSVLAESNKPGIINYFRDRGYEAFLMYLPGYKEPGVPSSETNKQTASELVEALIETSIEKIYFIDLIEDWLEFDIKNTQKYDLAMASLWCELACVNKTYNKEKPKVVEIDTIFRKYKIG